MALQNIPGAKNGLFGPIAWTLDTVPVGVNTTLDAANEAVIMVGQVETSDGSSHTINTTGSSSIGWRTGAVTFGNGGTTVKVGIAPVDTAAGPPARATNSSDVITFDVSASFTGGGGGITANAWQTHVPTTGTKTIANGDVIAICIQMTARVTDSVAVQTSSTGAGLNRPAITSFLGGSYTAVTALPNAIITFSDGALGWLHLSEVFAARTTLTFNSSSGTKEYGQLFNLPFPAKIYGFYGWAAASGDFDMILYSDPLGTPVAEKTVSIDANAVNSTTGRRLLVLFPSPYTYTKSTDVAAVFKPGGSNISTYSKTLNSATHRATDQGGTSSYGVSRASGAFANINSSLDQVYIGLIGGAFDDGVSVGGGGGLNTLGGRGGVIS